MKYLLIIFLLLAREAWAEEYSCHHDPKDYFKAYICPICKNKNRPIPNLNEEEGNKNKIGILNVRQEIIYPPKDGFFIQRPTIFNVITYKDENGEIKEQWTNECQ